MGYKVWQVGGLSPETMVVCLGFPAYFVVRKALKTEHIGGLLVDMLFMLPVAVFILSESQAGVAVLWTATKLLLMVPLLGAVSAFSVACFVTAGQLLPLGIFGLLSYVEPILLVVVALLLGEKIALNEMPTYAGVFLAVLILAIGGWLDLKKRLPRAAAGRGE